MGRRLRSGFPKEGVWFVTTTVSDFQPVFAEPKPAQAVLKEMARYSNIHEVKLYEYVVMPSHIHMIVQTTEGGGTLSSFMRDLKRSIAYECRNDWGGETGLWMDRFDDLYLNDEETLKIKVEYILNNPVKAGLSITPEEFPFSSAWARIQKQDVPCRPHEWALLWCQGCDPDTTLLERP